MSKPGRIVLGLADDNHGDVFMSGLRDTVGGDPIARQSGVGLPF